MHVIHHLYVGGMENGLVNLINGLDPAAFRHAIVCIEDDSEFRDRIRRDGVEIFQLHRSRTGVGALRRDLFRLFRRLRPAIVHSRNMSGLDAIVPAWLARVPVRVHGEHGWDVDDLQGRHWKPALLRRVNAPFVTHFITVSEHLQRYLVQRIGVAPARITRIVNGVDTQRFHPDTGRDDALFPPGFLPPDALVAGTVGRLQPVKDQATLLRAFAAWLAREPTEQRRARLVIVGDGPLRPALEQQIDELKLGPQVWLAGERTDVPALLRSLDLFVLPSLAEGISNTLLEAMASGLPVIATAVGGNPELVRPGDTGELFPAGDEASLVRLLAGSAADAGRRAAQARAARAAAVQCYSLRAMVDSYRHLYTGLLGA